MSYKLGEISYDEEMPHWYDFFLNYMAFIAIKIQGLFHDGRLEEKLK